MFVSYFHDCTHAFFRVQKATGDDFQDILYEGRMDVVAAILIQNQKFLLARRPETKNHGGLWEFPGGKIQKNESPIATLKRELQEELRIHEETPTIEMATVVESEKIRLHLYFWQLHSTYLPQEHTALAWASHSELSLFKLCPSDQKAIKQLQLKNRL